jgi:hypothetical protein
LTRVDVDFATGFPDQYETYTQIFIGLGQGTGSGLYGEFTMTGYVVVPNTHHVVHQGKCDFSTLPKDAVPCNERSD